MYINPAELDMTLCNKLCINQGVDWLIPVRLSNRVNTVDTPISLEGLVGHSTIKKYASDTEVIVSPTVTITDAANGEFTIGLTAEQTAGLITHGRTWRDVDTLQYDVTFENESTGEVYRALQGSVDVSPACTEEN